MAQRRNPGEVERGVKSRDPIDARRDVREGGGPAAALAPADTPVLHVPRGPSVAGQVGARRAHVAKRALGAPEATVEHDHHRVRSGAGRQVKLGALLRKVAVGLAPRGRAQVEKGPERAWRATRHRRCCCRCEGPTCS